MYLTAATMMVLTAGAHAQVLNWTQRVSEPGLLPPAGYTQSAEVALGVSQHGQDVMVAWIHIDETPMQTPIFEVRYNVSTNGINFGSSPTAIPGVVPVPNAPYPYTGDPMVAYSRTTGRGWVGAIESWTQSGMWVATKDDGFSTAQGTVLVDFGGPSIDKGLMGAAPIFGGGAETLGIFFSWSHSVLGFHILNGVVSLDHGVT
jgi:hypothetical protein